MTTRTRLARYAYHTLACVILMLLALTSAATAQVTLVDDDFANGSLGVNPGTGNGFVSYGQYGPSESGTNTFINTSGYSTGVIQSNDSFDPFLVSRETSVIWNLPIVQIQNDGRTWVGVRTATDSGNHFTPGRSTEGVFIAIDQRTGDNADAIVGNTYRGLVVSKFAGTTTILAEFSWDAYSGSNGALQIDLVTTQTTYAVSLSQAATVHLGSLSGSLTNAPTAQQFDVGGHHQATSSSSMLWDRVRVLQEPTVSFTAASQSNLESVSTVTVTAQLSAASSEVVSVPFTVTGSATLTDDYTITASPLSFGVGATSADITITVVDDTKDEENQTVTLTLGTATNGVASGTTEHEVTITDDDDPPTVSFEADKAVSEAIGLATVDVNLSAPSEKTITLTVRDNRPGTDATHGAGQDITSVTGLAMTFDPEETTQQVSLGINNDLADEGDDQEVLDFDQTTFVNVTAGTKTSHTLTILDNDAVVTLSESGSPLTEDGGVSTVIASIGAAQSLPITVNLAFTGTTDGSDYQTSASFITIPANETSGSMTITSIGDSDDEADESVIVDIDTVVDGQEGTPNQATATIEDDDAVVTLAASGTPSAEKAEGDITFTASISAAQTRDVTVNLNFGGTATGGGTDYTASGTQIVIQSPNTSGSVTATLKDDILDETNESIVASFASITNGQAGTPSSATGTITDDDADLRLTKSVSTALNPDLASGTVSYTLTVDNLSGTTPATNVTVLDPSLGTALYSSVSKASGTGTFASDTWTIGTINANSSVSIVLDATLAVEYTVTNYAEIETADQDDPDSTPGDSSSGDDDDASVTVRQYDFGDVPSSYNSTVSHEILSTGPYLGASVDSDSQAQSSGTAQGDDTDADGDDDDSVTLPTSFAIGSDASLSVAVNGSGFLYAWVDYNGDNVFSNATELEHAGAVSTGNATVVLNPPAGSNGLRQMRFRICALSTECDDPEEAAPNGEVEDYQISIIGVDFGDAPSPPYKTTFDLGGAQHEVGTTITHRLGLSVDGDLGAQENADATGDDTNGVDDEDGVTFATDIVRDDAIVGIGLLTVSTYGKGNLYGWIDFAGDGTFDNVDDRIIAVTDVGTASTQESAVYSFNVPTTAVAGNTFARFRFCADADCSSEGGLAGEGEVEDYQVTILDAAAAPQATISIPNGVGMTSPFTLTLNGAGTQLDVTDDTGTPIFRVPGSLLGPITINGTAGDDNLVVDFTNGNPIEGGLVFRGLDQSGGGVGDELTLNGGTFDSITHTFDNANDGSIVYTGGTAAAPTHVTYIGLEPVTQTVTVTDHYFVFTGGTETITLSDDLTPSNNQSTIGSTLGESVTFTNPTGLLRVEAGSGDDTINFTGIDDGITPTGIQIDGGVGEDIFNITPSANYGMLVEGGDPATCDGDVLDLDLTGITGQAQTIVGLGTGNWTFGSGELAINFSEMEIRADGNTDVSVTAAWDESSGYPADEREVVFTLTNNGTDEVNCVDAVMTIPAFLNLLPTYPQESYPAMASGSYAAGLWEIDRLLAGDAATLTFRGVVNTIIPGVFSTGVDASAGVPSDDPDLANNVTTDDFTVGNSYRFPRPAEAISGVYMELPSGSERIIAGLFQGAPGFNTAVFCRIPSPSGLFTAVGLPDHWRPCGEGLPYPLHVNDMVVDDRGTPGVDDDRLWLTSWGSAGLYYSDDFGETFTAIAPNLGQGAQPWANVYSLTKDAGSVLYISANNGLVFRSFNDGGTWQQVASLPDVAADTPWSLQAHPSEAGTVYAGTFGGGVFVTTDFGFNWARLGGDAFNNALLDIDGSGDDFAGHVFDFAFSPDGAGDFLFAGTGRGVWRMPLDAAGVPTGTWTQLPLVATLDGGATVVPEIRVLAFAAPSVDPDEDLLAGSWGLGAFVSASPRGAGSFAELALREGRVSMLLVTPDGILVGSSQGGIAPLSPEAVSTAVTPGETALPDGYALEQNYPNPFNPVTRIAFALPETGKVRLMVFDTLGREVEVLADGVLHAGLHEVSFDARDLPSGAYVYRLETQQSVYTRQMVLMK